MNKLLKTALLMAVTATAITANAAQPTVEMNKCAAVYMVANTKFGGDINASRWATKHNFLFQRARRISLDNRTDPAIPMNQGYVPIANYYLEKAQVNHAQFERELLADLARCDQYYQTVDGAVAAENAGIGYGNTIQFQW